MMPDLAFWGVCVTVKAFLTRMVTKTDIEISACSSAPIVPFQLRFAFSCLLAEIDECDSKPCMNGATCLEDVGSYSCKCVAGFTGDNCEISKSKYLITSKDGTGFRYQNSWNETTFIEVIGMKAMFTLY